MSNKDHIERLFKENYRQLHQLARMLLQYGDLARDMVHDVFVTLLAVENRDNVSSRYLLGAVRNRCLNHIRNTSVTDRLKAFYYLEADEYDTEVWPDEETISKIYQIIKTELSPRCREAMDLRFVEGLKFSEISKRMCISEVAVYGHIRHAIETLRKKLN